MSSGLFKMLFEKGLRTMSVKYVNLDIEQFAKFDMT